MEKENRKVILQSTCKRFVFVGAESTGKTTLAKELVHYFQKKGPPYSNVPFVEEYGRAYTYEKLRIVQSEAILHGKPKPGMESLVWTTEDFIKIAQQQNVIEGQAAQNQPMIICDTDSFATAIWYQRYCNDWNEELEQMIQELPSRALYLLTDDVGIPFEQDEIRDGAHLRAWMTERFEQEMKQRHFPYIKLQGDHINRLQTSISEIELRL